MEQPKKLGYAIGGFTAAAAACIIDFFLPPTYKLSVLYLLGLFVTIQAGNRRFVAYYVIFATLLLLADSFLIPGDVLSAGIFQNMVALVLIWVSAAVTYRYKGAADSKSKDAQQLEALYNAATESIIVTDSQGRIVLANPTANQQFGYSREELIGLSVDMLLPESMRKNHVQYRDSYRDHPNSRPMGMGRDLFARKKDGSIFPVEISLSYFRKDDELFVISFIIDITKRKESEHALVIAKQNLERYAEALKNSNQELEQFAYIASHDLQEPLRKIMAFGDRLQKKEEAVISEESKDYLARMLNAAGRMKNLINDLLSFSRITSKGRPFEKLDMNALVKDVLGDLEFAIERYHTHVALEHMPVIKADPMQMRQLFQNLIANAIKFSANNVQPDIRIFSEELEDGLVRFHVKDNGIGFDEKYLDRIFTIFQRLEGQNFEGSGVGLAICKKIVQRHGGTITAHSAPGQGADFIVTIPKEHQLIA